MAKGKKTRIRLESQIQQLLQKDNGVTAHFDYKINMNSKKNTVQLNLLTFNPIHDDYMLLRKVNGSSAIECLENMHQYILKDEARKDENSYTITWKQKESDEKRSNKRQLENMISFFPIEILLIIFRHFLSMTNLTMIL